MWYGQKENRMEEKAGNRWYCLIGSIVIEISDSFKMGSQLLIEQVERTQLLPNVIGRTPRLFQSEVSLSVLLVCKIQM